jgi:protein-disulfide isomerase
MRESIVRICTRLLPTVLLAAALGILAYNQYRARRVIDAIEQRLAAGQRLVEGRTALRPVLPKEPIDTGSAATLGAASAPVILIEFSDFECPFCARFTAETLPILRRDYVDRGVLRVVFRQMPLTRIHPHAQAAATASICAREQGQFWKMHDALFAESRSLNPQDFGMLAASLGLDKALFDRCVSHGMAEEISADVLSGKALGVTGTPTIFLGRRTPSGGILLLRRVAGAVPAAQLARQVDELLQHDP